MRRLLELSVLLLHLFAAATAGLAQTNLHVIAADGVWTWLNDPRALFHNGRLYVAHVRTDGRSTLTSYNPVTGLGETVWTSSWAEADDSDNAGLVRLEDGRLMAVYARHSNFPFFALRTSLNTNPSSAADWGPEQTVNVSANVTYANPYQLSAEGGRIYNFMRNLNFNPTFLYSDNLGATWSTPKILIQSGSGSSRPFVKYASDYVGRIHFLYTDAHPRNVNTSLYHAYYENGALQRSDGSFLKYLTNAPLLHDSGERGSVVYQYSDMPTADPNEHITGGRAWCWEIVHPVCVFSVQRDNVMGSAWTDDRIYYYYARWTGTNWQKRFIAHAGRPLHETEDDYAGGICVDPHDPSVVYLSSNAADPFNLATLNAPLRPNERYELYRGVTADEGLTFSWTALTTNSVVDNLRPYVPRHGQGAPAVIWFRGSYSTYNVFNCSVVALLTNETRLRPTVRITSPAAGLIQLTNLANSLKLKAVAEDDGHPEPLTVQWTTTTGPTNAVFSDASNPETLVTFAQPGHYVLRIWVSDGLSTAQAAVTIYAGPLTATTNADPSRVLWLKLDETFGGTASDSSGNGLSALVFGGTWQPSGGMRNGALKLSGNASRAQIIDSPLLDNTSAFTLAYWFRIDAWPGFRTALAAKCESAGSGNAYSMLLDPASRRINIDINGSNDRFSGPPLTNGVWYHVALVYNGAWPAAQRVQLWLDGVLERVAAETSASIPDHFSQFRLGWIAGDNSYFNGAMDDVRFHRRALSADEVIALALLHTAPSVSPGPAPAATNRIATRLNGHSTAPARWTQLSGPANATFNPTNPATVIEFIRAGDYLFRLSAETSIATVCQDLAINVLPNFHIYEDWIARAFPGITDPLIVAERADPDGDGELNFVEFGLASDPSQPAPSQFRIERKPDGSLLLIHPARTDPTRIYEISTSPDLRTWQDAYPYLSLDAVTQPPNQDEYQILHYWLREGLPATSFFRIRVN